MHRPLITAAVFSLALAASIGSADANPLRLGRNFSPHPLVTQEFSIRVDTKYRVNDMGFQACKSSGFSQKDPVLEWDLTEDFPELNVRLEDRAGGQAGSGGIVVMPNGGYLCSTKGDIYFKNWPKGHYKLYLHSISIGASAIVRFEIPSRSKDAVTTALAALPTFTVGQESGENPRYFAFKPTAKAEAADAGIGCVKARDQIMPLARINVTKSARYFLGTGKDRLFIVTADNKCAEPSDSPDLAVGVHTLWAVVPRDGTINAAELEIDDRSRPLAWRNVESKAAGALDAPLVISGKQRAAEKWASRDRLCRKAAREPDFYFTSDRPLQKVELSILWSKQRQVLHVFGPLETVKPTSSPWCDEEGRGGTQQSFDIFEGTYAVWVGGEATSVGSDYHVLLRRKDVEIAPLTSLAPIPDELEMHERALRNHYPYFNSDGLKSWEAIFAAAPDRLFVYARADVDEGPTKLRAGEPLLVQFSGNDRSAVWRYNGKNASVKTQLLTTARPEKIWLPERAEIPDARDLGDYMRDAGPEDQKDIDTYNKLDSKYTGCVGSYMAKNDPTWGHGHEVYKISGNGKVSNVSDEYFRTAAKKCGESKVEAAAKALMKKLAKTRDARYKAHLAAARKRFGL